MHFHRWKATSSFDCYEDRMALKMRCKNFILLKYPISDRLRFYDFQVFLNSQNLFFFYVWSSTGISENNSIVRLLLSSYFFFELKRRMCCGTLMYYHCESCTHKVSHTQRISLMTTALSQCWRKCTNITLITCDRDKKGKIETIAGAHV